MFDVSKDHPIQSGTQYLIGSVEGKITNLWLSDINYFVTWFCKQKKLHCLCLLVTNNYMRTFFDAMVLSIFYFLRGVNSNIISWNRVILLHGKD